MARLGRVLSAAIIAGVSYSEWTYFAIFFAICLFTLLEFYNLVGLDGLAPQKAFGTLSGVLIFCLSFLIEGRITIDGSTMTEAEFNHMAKEMRPVVDADLVLLAEKEDGEPIGFLLALPDLNRAFKHLPDGRLFPFGLFKFLWQKRKIDTARLLTLGLKPGYQHLGLGAAMYTRLLQIGVGKGYKGAEGSWILEDNHEMCTALEKLGADKYKRYRVYDRVL